MDIVLDNFCEKSQTKKTKKLFIFDYHFALTANDP